MHTHTFCKYRKKLLASPRVHLVVKLMRFKNSSPFIEIVLLKFKNIFHKINYPEEYSTSNDISYQALGPLFS